MFPEKLLFVALDPSERAASAWYRVGAERTAMELINEGDVDGAAAALALDPKFEKCIAALTSGASGQTTPLDLSKVLVKVPGHCATREPTPDDLKRMEDEGLIFHINKVLEPLLSVE